MEVTIKSPYEIDWGLQELHKKMLEILKYLDSFCTEHDIDYCLAFGSALGAKRQGGYIPWDDDVDIYMTADGYAKFRSIFARIGDHERFYLQEYGAIDNMVIFPKFRMNGTTFIEENLRNLDMHHGIYVDIFILHGCPLTNWEKMLHILAIKYITIKRLSNQHYAKRKAWLPIMALLRLFPKEFLLKQAYRQIYRWDKTESDLYSDTGGRFFNKKLIFPAKQVPFETTTLCVPRQLDDYLTMIYGNYMQVPTIKQIKWAQHASEWSTSEDFRNFAPNIHNFADETY
jgi:lipopolysaccharide cholinephosphotransferase